MGEGEGARRCEGRLVHGRRQRELERERPEDGAQHLRDAVARVSLLAQASGHDERRRNCRVEVAAADARSGVDEHHKGQPVADGRRRKPCGDGVGIRAAADELEEEDADKLGNDAVDGDFAEQRHGPLPGRAGPRVRPSLSGRRLLTPLSRTLR